MCYLSIKSWEANHGWQNFSKIFTSQRVIDEKPMGVYMIPIFTGDDARGHWYTIIIEKRRNCSQGWIVDSLGNSNPDKNLLEKIPRAFLPGRGRFLWTAHESRMQTECECGPRTILTLHTIDLAIAAGHTMERAVRVASFLHIGAMAYNAKAERLEAALLVDI